MFQSTSQLQEQWLGRGGGASRKAPAAALDSALPSEAHSPLLGCSPQLTCVEQAVEES
jgi:hypothetical protein